jgi:hypothetical protein
METNSEGIPQIFMLMSQSWIQRLPEAHKSTAKYLEKLFSDFVGDAIMLVIRKCKEALVTGKKSNSISYLAVEAALIQSLLNLMECLLPHIVIKIPEGDSKPEIIDFEADSIWESQEPHIQKYLLSLEDDHKMQAVDNIFLFSLVWSIGAVVDVSGRHLFDSFVRDRIIGSNWQCYVYKFSSWMSKSFPSSRTCV